MIKRLRINNKVLASLILSSSLFVTGCTVDCNIEDQHAHLYSYHVNDDVDYRQYIVSEAYVCNNMTRRNEYIIVDDEQKERLKFISESDINNSGTILKISENPDYVEYFSNKYKDVLEYKCESYVIHPKGTYPANPLNKYTQTRDKFLEYYTENPNALVDTTGERRLTYYTYYGYNLVQNEDGEYELVRSIDYDSFDEVLDSCEYMTTNSYNKHQTNDEEFINSYLEDNKTLTK